MTATNHALSGALIAATIPNPLIGLPLALISHFILDALPHFGNVAAFNEHKSRSFLLVLLTDMAGACIVGLSIVLSQPQSWFYMGLAAFLATSPDLMWFPSFWRSRHGGSAVPGNNFVIRFHTVIQWCEKPWGLLVEIPFAAILVVLLMRAIK